LGKKKYKINMYLRNTSILHFYLEFQSKVNTHARYLADASI